MRLVSRSTKGAASGLQPRMYFVHIPKTAGITLKAYLENNYANGEALVIDEWKARELPPEELRQFRLLSGHYSSEVLDALGERPDVTLMLVREPISRFRSWMAHCRRLTSAKYRDMCNGRTDREVLLSEDGYTCQQAHWLARAIRDGAACTTVPQVSELNALLARIDVAGVTDEIERFMQLVAFKMGWPPPQLGWHINRRPDTAGVEDDTFDISDEELRPLLAIDQQLYEMATARFWSAYTDMLTALRPDAPAFTPDTARGVSVDLAQNWLRHHFEATQARQFATAVASIDIAGDAPSTGEGWWWRECPQHTSYRWTGPGTDATLYAPMLETDTSYTLTLDAMGAADWPAWESVTVDVNGHPVAAVRERFEPRLANQVAIRLEARIDPAAVAAQDGLTRITLHVPQTKQALAHVQITESFDTVRHDMRAVGLAVHRVQIRKTAARVKPLLSLRAA